MAERKVSRVTGDPLGDTYRRMHDPAPESSPEAKEAQAEGYRKIVWLLLIGKSGDEFYSDVQLICQQSAERGA